MFSLGVNYTKRNHVIICICGFCFPKLRWAVGSLTVGVVVVVVVVLGQGGGGGFRGLFCANVSNANTARRLLEAVRAAICHHNPS